jgi:hypothetical protein
MLEYLITKTLSTHEASDSQFSQIMQCTVTYAIGLYSQLPKIGYPIKLLISGMCHADTLYLRENRWLIFFKPKGVREQNSLRNTPRSYETLLSRAFVDFFASRFRICLGNNELAESTHAVCFSIF